LADRFEHRIIRFLAAETLDTLSANHAEIRSPGSGLMKLVNKGGLSDTRLFP
jgi:hypothetical protein